jgi:hypothetical protein
MSNIVRMKVTKFDRCRRNAFPKRDDTQCPFIPARAFAGVQLTLSQGQAALTRSLPYDF